MVYYKGYLIDENAYEETSLLIGDLHYQGYSKLADTLREYFLGINDYIDTNKINKFIHNVEETGKLSIKDKGIIDTIDNYFEKNKNKRLPEAIIYEIIEDDTGMLFGKELITGLIFPMMKNIIYTVDEKKQEYYISLKSTYPRVFKRINGGVVSSDWIYSVKESYDDSELIIDSQIESLCETITLRELFVYYLHKKMVFPNELMAKVNVSINEIDVATNNEIEDYKKRHMGFKKRKYEKRIESLYKENVFKRNVIEKNDKNEIKKIFSQDKIIICMENIEYMLFKLSEIDEELYNKYQEQYQRLLDGENTDKMHLSHFSHSDFYLLEGEIEIILKCLKRNTHNILDYLESLKKEYLDNFFNNNDKTDITLDELDEMNELFNKSKEKYLIVDQRKIMKEFALVYLFEAIENSNNIDVDRLENSYFKLYLKTIVMYIRILEDLGLFNSNVYYELEDNITLQKVVNIIQNINIVNSVDKEKVLKKFVTSKKIIN